MTIDTLLSRLQNARPTASGGWTARCPAHDDRRNSLSVRQDGDKLLVHCFAGCKTEDVLMAVGLGWKDLFSDNGHRPEVPPPKLQRPDMDPLTWWTAYCRVPIDFARTLPLEADGDRLAFTFGPAAVRKLRPSGAKTFSWQPPGSPTPALWPMPGVELPEGIWLCEGESDATVARYVGLEAFALTHGAGAPLTPDQAAELRRRGVEKAVVCFDADPPGRDGAFRLAAVLQAAGIEVLAADLAAAGLVDPLAGTKDMRDAWLAVQDPHELRRKLESAAAPVPLQLATPADADLDADDDTPPPAQADDAIARLRKLLRLPSLIGVRKYGRVRAEWDLLLNDGSAVPLGSTGDLCSYLRVYARILEASGAAIPSISGAKWRQRILPLIVAAAVEETLPPETEETREWLDSYIASHRPVDKDAWAGERHPLRDSDGRVYLPLREVVNYVSLMVRAQTTAHDLMLRLRRIDFEPTLVQVRSGGERCRARFWASPPGWLQEGGD